MEIKEWLSIVAIAFSLFAFLYCLYLLIQKNMNLELRSEKDILNWYSNTICPMQELIAKTSAKTLNQEDMHCLMAKLSSQIEIGRFFFPNMIKKMVLVMKNLLPIVDIENIVLDLLVFFHRVFEKDNYDQYLNHARILQRHFTSEVFEIFDPNSHIKESAKITKKIHEKTYV